MTKFEHKYDYIYFDKCPEQNCTDTYLGVSARRISDRIIDHAGRDQNPHLFRYAVVNDHHNASYDDFEIIGSGYRNNAFKRKVAETVQLVPAAYMRWSVYSLTIFAKALLYVCGSSKYVSALSVLT